MQKFEYRGVVVKESSSASELVLFAAPAHEIDKWSGIPQPRRVEGVETAGFQREQKERRVAQLAQFLSDPANVIQNPLLAATQDGSAVTIERHDDGTASIQISIEDHPRNITELLQDAMSALENRMPDLAERPVPEDKLTVLREDYDLTIPPEVDTDVSDTGEPQDESDSDPTLGLFEEETQVVDFYDELAARHQLGLELGSAADEFESIGGFTRDFLTSLVQPIVLVDGQHRLQGALEAIELRKASDDGSGTDAHRQRSHALLHRRVAIDRRADRRTS